MGKDKNKNEEAQKNEEVLIENEDICEDTNKEVEEVVATIPKEEFDKLDAKLKELSIKCDEYFDKIQRNAAEFDNYKKRTVKEKEALYTDAFADAVQVFLPVADNMERAIAAITEDSTEVKTLKEGVDMVFNQLKEVFAKLGVEEIEAEGKTFDPNIHNAVMHIEDDGYGENQVAEVFQKGYKLKDKVLRHSMVKVVN
jgi:molecular chaperone GrpE